MTGEYQHAVRKQAVEMALHNHRLDMTHVNLPQSTKDLLESAVLLAASRASQSAIDQLENDL